MPKNTGSTPDRLLRRRDCAVLNWYLGELEAVDSGYDTVRAGFVEGGRAFPGAGIMKETHIQLAVRNPGCIIGVPRPIHDVMSKRRPSKEFVPPPHANAEAHGLVMERVESMSREEFVDSLVRAGICSPDGKLTEHYREPSKSKPKGTKAA